MREKSEAKGRENRERGRGAGRNESLCLQNCIKENNHKKEVIMEVENTTCQPTLTIFFCLKALLNVVG